MASIICSNRSSFRTEPDAVSIYEPELSTSSSVVSKPITSFNTNIGNHSMNIKGNSSSNGSCRHIQGPSRASIICSNRSSIRKVPDAVSIYEPELSTSSSVVSKPITSFKMNIGNHSMNNKGKRGSTIGSTNQLIRSRSQNSCSTITAVCTGSKQRTNQLLSHPHQHYSTVDLCFKRPGAGKVWGIKKKLELLIFLTKIIHR